MATRSPPKKATSHHPILLFLILSLFSQPCLGHGAGGGGMEEYQPGALTFSGNCQCSVLSLCQPIMTHWPSELLGFLHIGRSAKNKNNQLLANNRFPWDRVTGLVLDQDPGEDNTELGKVVCAAHAQNTRVFVTVDGTTGDANQRVDNWTNRTLAVLMQTHADGLSVRLKDDVSQSQAYQLLSSLSKSLKTNLPHVRILLTLRADQLDCTPSASSTCRNVTQLMPLVTQLYLDTYSKHHPPPAEGEEEGVCQAAGSSLAEVERWLDHLEGDGGVPLANVTLGLGWLGYDFVCSPTEDGNNGSEPCRLSSCQSSAGTPSPLSILHTASGHRYTSPTGLQAHLTYTDSTNGRQHQVFYDTATGLEAKYSLVGRRGLAGFGVYQLDYDESLWRGLPMVRMKNHTSPGIPAGMAFLAIFVLFIILA